MTWQRDFFGGVDDGSLFLVLLFQEGASPPAYVVTVDYVFSRAAHADRLVLSRQGRIQPDQSPMTVWTLSRSDLVLETNVPAVWTWYDLWGNKSIFHLFHRIISIHPDFISIESERMALYTLI